MKSKFFKDCAHIFEQSFNCSPRKTIFWAFIFLVVLGCSLFWMYGASGDEPIERNNGIVSLRYIAEKFSISRFQSDPNLSYTVDAPELNKYRDRDYPVAFNLPAVALERLLGIGNDGDERKIYLFRHLLTFLVNLVGVVAVYQLAKRRFNDWRIGLLAATFLVLSPRFFAESFYNSKDVVFMSFFALSTYTAISFILKPTWKNAIWHSLATAIAIDVRIMAIVIPAMTILMLGLRIARGEIPWRKTIALAILYLGFAALVVVICWPWLWADPWARFVEAFQKMSKFSRGPQELLYWGEVLKTANLPWHYIPVWIAITTPLLYLALFFVGIGATLKTLVKRHWRLWQGEQELQDLIFLGLFIVPILAVIVLRSTLYDGWRQMYFVYPAFLLLSIKGWTLLRDHSYTQPLLQKWAKPALTTILCISFAWTTVWMIKAHPLQNVYFNALAGKNWKSKFDVDYWGLSNRMALEYILGRDSGRLIVVSALDKFTNLPSEVSLLPAKNKKRIAISKKDDYSDYLITNYRLVPGGCSQLDNFTLLKDIKVFGEAVTSICLQHSSLPKLHIPSLGERIDFSKNGKGRLYLKGVGAKDYQGYGWSYPEPWGTWSDGARVEVLIPTPKEHAEYLEMELMPFINKSHINNEIEIYINSVYQLRSKFQSNKITSLDLDVSKISGEKNYIKIDIIILNPANTFEVDIKNDKRQLGIGLISMTYK